MIQVTNFIKLDFNRSNDITIPTIEWDQGSRFVRVQLQNNNQNVDITGSQVVITVIRNDLEEIIESCNILDAKEGIIEFEISKSMVARQGDILCQLKLSDNNSLLSSQLFKISVNNTLMVSLEESRSDMDVLIHALGEVQNIDNRFAQTNAQLSLRAYKSEVGSPLVASSVEEMIDKTKVYVNTSDNNWYSWNGTTWIVGGIYNSQGIGNRSITEEKTTFFNVGKNKFKPMILNETYNGVTIELNSKCELILNGTCTGNKTVVISDDTSFVPTSGETYSISIFPIAGNIDGETNTHVIFGFYEKNTLLLNTSTSITSRSGVINTTLPTQVFKIYLTKGHIYNNYKVGLQFEKGTKTNFEPFIYKLSNYLTEQETKDLIRSTIEDSTTSENNMYKLLKVNCLGDSLTYGFLTSSERMEKPYPTVLQEMLGFDTVRNYGVSGTCLSNNPGYNNNPMCTRFTSMDDDADLIIVMGGTNDYLKQVTIGDIDSTDDTTFYGGLNKLCTELIKKYPHCNIILCTIPHNGSSKTIKTAEYSKAVREVADKFSLLVFDAHGKVGLNNVNILEHTVEGTHFTQKFVSDIFAPKLANFIKNNYFNW